MDGVPRRFALLALRPQPGQGVSAANMRRLLAGSPLVASHRENDPRVQDAYSLRCAPQVNGAARDTLVHAEAIAASSAACRFWKRFCKTCALRFAFSPRGQALLP